MRLSCAAAALFLVAIGCDAQQEEMRAKVRSEVDAARQASHRAAATFLDRSQSTEARLTAVAGLDAIVDRGDAAAALELVIDPEQPVAIRVRALQLAAHEIEQDQQLVSELLSLLVSQDTPMELRRAIAEVGRVLLISGTGAPRGEDVVTAMRTMAKDPDPTLRGMALGMLAANDDDVAQQMLAADLRDPSVELVPPEQAVAMLAMHPDGDTLPALRDVLAHPPNAAAQLEAISALGADPQSHDELQAVIADDNATDEVRMAAGGALHANAPELFSKPAVKVVEDEGASDELRIFAIKAVQSYRAARGPFAATSEDKTFDQAVRKLAAKAKSAAVRNAAKEYAATVK